MKKDERTVSAAPLVPLDEVANAIGYGGNLQMLDEAAGWVGMRLEVAEDWQGNRGLPVEHAAQLVSGARAYMEDHYAKWEAYREYLAERRQTAQAERDRLYRAERKAAQEAARRRQEQWSAELERRTREESEARAQAKAERDGKPLTPEQFFRRAG